MIHDTALPLLRQRPVSAGDVLGAAGLPAPGRAPARALYIHVPFCFHRCHYCDFFSVVDRGSRHEAFVARLERELQALSPWTGGQPLRTIFIGGGTPTLLSVPLWQRLLNTLHEHFDLSLITAAGQGDAERGEFTVECNPETASKALFAILAEGGVNRLSIGVQSMNPAHLRMLQRWHDPQSVPRAVELAREAGIVRVNLDLIFAIPGQTLAQWDEDLESALALGPTHLSCYALTYEAGTAMTARLARGEFVRVDEETEAAMYEHAVARLRAAGLPRYEVSNFAVPGYESQHNLAYWRCEAYLAAGPSASGLYAGHRWTNAASLDRYLAEDDHGFAPVSEHEPPDPARRLAETIMMGLRLEAGVDAPQILRAAEQLGGGCAERLQGRVRRHVARGHMEDSQGRWRLTDAGFLVADAIVADLFAAVL